MEVREIYKAAKILSRSPGIENWRNICEELHLASDEVDLLETRYYHITRSYHYKKKFDGFDHYKFHELYFDILTNWKLANRNQATVENLSATLKKLNYNWAAERLFTELNPGSFGSSLFLKFPIEHYSQKVVPKYFSRRNLENEIIHRLCNDNSKDLDSLFKFPVVVVYGEKGIGKTTIARVVCERVEKFFFKNIIWINAENEEKIITYFAEHFGMIGKEKKIIQTTIKDFYSSQLKTSKCLLIFDNVADFKVLPDYLPVGLETQASVIVTSNSEWYSKDYRVVTNILVGALRWDEFLEFAWNIIPNIFAYELGELDWLALIRFDTRRNPYYTKIILSEFAEFKIVNPGGKVEDFVRLKETEESRDGETSSPISKFTRKKEPTIEKVFSSQKSYPLTQMEKTTTRAFVAMNLKDKMTTLCNCKDPSGHNSKFAVPIELIWIVLWCDSQRFLKSEFLWTIFQISFNSKSIEDFQFGIDYLKFAIELIKEETPDASSDNNRLDNLIIIDKGKQCTWTVKLILEIEATHRENLDEKLSNGILKLLQDESSFEFINRDDNIYHITSIFNRVCAMHPDKDASKMCISFLKKVLELIKRDYVIGNLGTINLS